MKACKACREKFWVYLPRRQIYPKYCMDAFNVPYCGIDLNQAIGNLSFVSTQAYSLESKITYHHTVSSDLCVIHINVAVTSNTVSAYDFSITSLKDNSFNSITVSLAGGVSLSKEGTKITMSQSYNISTVLTDFIIYEFNFA